MKVYINDLASFLPNEPVPNDQIERVLGMVNRIPSRTRRIILRNNKIQQRYYAIDPETREQTHTNAQLTAEAVRGLQPYEKFLLNDIECLSCGTASPDQFFPGHASMVHGELENPPCEVVSTSGVCVSGMTAMKYAWLNVAAGQAKNAVATGSELSSSYLRGEYCKRPLDEEAVQNLDKTPILGFNADFLRWMLSDGAGAAFMSGEKNRNGVSLQIDWIEVMSFANMLETCMYAGAVKEEDGSITGWRNLSPEEAIEKEALLVKQDVKLLNSEIIITTVDRALPPIIEKYGLQAEDYDWFLPHYSSEYFRQQIYDHMAGIGFEIPYEKWYTNLVTKGNTGAASIYIILDELFHSGELHPGQKLLCFIPESGRFTMCYMQLTVV